MNGHHATLAVGAPGEEFFPAHPELQAMLRAARAGPDDLPWLAIADWLQDHDLATKAATLRSWVAIRRAFTRQAIELRPLLQIAADVLNHFGGAVAKALDAYLRPLNSTAGREGEEATP